MQHFKYAVGDQVQDLTFDPPLNGIIIAKHITREDAYHVRIDGASSDVVIHARNLRKR
jgi:hypothetical protein